MPFAGRLVRAAALAGCVALPAVVRADVVFTEVMYHPPGGTALEYVELHNTGEAGVDLSGWAIEGGVAYRIPDGAELAPGGRLVIAASREALLEAYDDLDPAVVLGDWTGALSNRGEDLGLVDAAGGSRERFVFADGTPWDPFADGLGPSLERLCPGEDPADPANWRAGPVPPAAGEPGGSPGAAGPEAACPPAPRPPPSLRITEIHYHAILEESFEDQHEFIEIHNPGEAEVSLAGWRLAGGIDFAFPGGEVVPPGGYRVVAGNRRALAEVEAWELSVGEILGDWDGVLDNGGEAVGLVGPDGRGVEMVRYDDEFPWPVAADAFGAGESWLASELRPLEEHRWMGRSLERIAVDHPAEEPANWAASPVDGCTPGRPNASARPTVLPIAGAVSVTGPDGDGLPIRSGQDVLVQVAFRPEPPAGEVQVEWFVEDLASDDEPRAMVRLVDDGTNGDILPADGVYSGTVPGQSANSVVRYRVLADRGGDGLEPVAPRASHPNPWRSWFVEPELNTDHRTYHVFVSPEDWGRMWTNVSPGRVNGCTPNPRWDDKVDAVFVHDGEVFDVHARYQGSRWNRTNGPDLRGWAHPRPTTGPLRALSWRLSFPRYANFDGLPVIVLNKLTQSCPGFNSWVGFKLFARADLPAPLTRYVRLQVNGGYYRYMIEYERPGEPMIRRYHRELAEKHPGLPVEPPGHLYKSSGCNCDEGPYGWGDERILRAQCGYSAEERYATTYDRKIHEWLDHSDFIEMIEELHRARRGGREALRQYFQEYWDIDLLLNYMAIINWQVPFDDMFQNHFLYQRRSDGKWMFAPWDLDRNFGQWQGPNSSIYMGEQGNPSNRSGWWNYVKDAFLKSYRTEFEDRLLLLNNTLLHPDEIARMVDEAAAAIDPREAAAAAAPPSCSFSGRVRSFKSFASARHELVNRMAGARVDAGPDQTVFAGETVQFDARDSEPDPSEDVVYRWSNGMEGDFPTYVWDAPGEHELTLTVEMRGIPFTDTVQVTVLPRPDRVHRERDGLVVIEAEDFFAHEDRGVEDVRWTVDDVEPGAVGSYMEAREIVDRRVFLTRYSETAPELRYAIRFDTAGTWYVWLRGLAPTSRADTLNANLLAAERGSGWALELEPEAGWHWAGVTRREGPLAVEVDRPGLSFLSVWMRESGLLVDRLVLARDADFTPQDDGPPSTLEGEGGGEPFVRGDADGSGTLLITDAVVILRHLFSGEASLACEDPADVDDDGSLAITDAVVLLDFLFRGGSDPAAPFPGPGLDPTPDDPWTCGDAGPDAGG